MKYCNCCYCSRLILCFTIIILKRLAASEEVKMISLQSQQSTSSSERELLKDLSFSAEVSVNYDCSSKYGGLLDEKKNTEHIFEYMSKRFENMENESRRNGDFNRVDLHRWNTRVAGEYLWNSTNQNPNTYPRNVVVFTKAEIINTSLEKTIPLQFRTFIQMTLTFNVDGRCTDKGYEGRIARDVLKDMIKRWERIVNAAVDVVGSSGDGLNGPGEAYFAVAVSISVFFLKTF